MQVSVINADGQYNEDTIANRLYMIANKNCWSEMKTYLKLYLLKIHKRKTWIILILHMHKVQC